MKHWTTKSNYRVFKVHGGRCNSYLVRSENTTLLVDNGTKQACSSLLRNIKNTGTDPGSIDYLVLTHTHFDHCQNTNRLKKSVKTKIIISKKEKEFSEEGFTPLPKGTMIITPLE